MGCENSHYDIARTHEIQLNIALEVKRICEKNNIKYIIIAGTLLGAVRHKGFIPWDDDLDIGMLRDEYNRFIEACKNDLNEEYFLQNWDSDSGFALPFSKVRKNGTIYLEKNSSKAAIHHGIYIDIFPFDDVPSGNLQRFMQKTQFYFLKRLLLAKSNYTVWSNHQFFKKATYYILNKLSFAISSEQLKEIINSVMFRYNTEKSETVTNFGGAYGYTKESIQRIWLEENNEIDFEGYSFSAPIGYDDYLKYLYGDYMTPPPKDKRNNRHGIIKIDFGEEDD